MAQRTPLTFTAEALQALARERYEHPHPRVQQRMELLWLTSQGIPLKQAARLAGVSRATAARYLAAYRQGGLDALRQCRWHQPSSAWLDHRETLEESFRPNPPPTVAEACARIKAATGLERRPTQVRAFLKKCLG
jgi:transposase